MKYLILALVVVLGLPALASPYFPLAPGAIWTLADDDPETTMMLVMSGPEVWHDGICYPRYEQIDGEAIGFTYWSVDSEGRTLLHGLRYVAGSEYYFSPPAVYIDPSLDIGETVVNQVNVFEVEDMGDRWWGLFPVSLTCVNRDAVVTPLGTVPGLAVDITWNGIQSYPWRYANDAVLAYGFGVGPARITGDSSGEDLFLIEVENLHTTAVPIATGHDLFAAPNPFNPATTIHFETAAAGPVRLEILDVAGHRVAVLHDEFLGAGPHQTSWRPTTTPSGVYLVRLVTPTASRTTRITLLE